MLIIENKEFDSIDKILRRYKKKFDRTQVLSKIRAKKYFTKKSIMRRNEIKRARYAQLKSIGLIEAKD